MAPAPLRSPPGRPLTHSGGSARHGKKKEDQKQKAKAKAKAKAELQLLPASSPDRSHPRMAWIYQTQPNRRAAARCNPTVTGKLSKVGRCGLAGPLAPWARGMPRAGWAGRPTPVLPCAQDSAHEQGAIEPHGRVYGVSCQPTTPRPTHRSPEPLWLWLWLWHWLWLWPLRVQGATLPKPLRCARRAWPGATRNKKAAFRRPFCYFSLISRRRSSRKPCAVIGSGYLLGFSSVMHEGSTSIRKSGFGCRKNGTE